jgi:hypothetical protein
MVIVADFGQDVQTYCEHFDQLCFPCPAQCPHAHCQAPEPLVSHGSYTRQAVDPARAYPYVLRIKRWRCTRCGGTVSVLPSFLVCGRHYLLVVIQAVVVSRYEQVQSWSQVEAQTSVDGAPSRRTAVRWCQAFAQSAPRWLAQVQRVLAQHDSASTWLDPLGEAVQAGSAPRALLLAVVHFLAWAQSQWPALQAYGRTARLSVLWHWGYAQGLARLV